MKDEKKRILALAEKEMLELRAPYLSSEHLMLALLKLDGFKDFMEYYGVVYDEFLLKIKELVGVGTKGLSEGESIKWTPALEQVLLDYNQLAKKRTVSEVPYLMMLAMIDFGEGVALRILDSMDVDIDELHRAIVLHLDNTVTSLIKKFPCLINLNEEVEKNKTVVTGFDKELDQLCHNLLKLQKPNVVITGEPGVGKTALVEKLAIAINEKQVPSFLQNLVILQLSLGTAIAGTKYRGEFEEKISGIINAVSDKPNIILFIDEFHTMVGAGGAEGAIDASNLFKPALARGKIRMIGATTKEEYDEFIKKEKAFARRFNTLNILEATKEETLNILRKARIRYESHFGITITDEDILKIYSDSTHRVGRMPDIALDELEEFSVNSYYKKDSKPKKVKVGASN